jgi:hypothetical protein
MPRPSLIPHAPTPTGRSAVVAAAAVAAPTEPTHIPPSAPHFAPMVAAVSAAAAPHVADALGGSRGAEYDAIVKLSREVIEQIAWEVVPDLAETIIRAHVERLAKERAS